MTKPVPTLVMLSSLYSHCESLPGSDSYDKCTCSAMWLLT